MQFGSLHICCLSHQIVLLTQNYGRVFCILTQSPNMRGPKMAQGAAQANNLEILRALLDAGADLSLEDECRQGSGVVWGGFSPTAVASCQQPGPRWTPLHYASQFGYLKIVETLLDAKAEAAPKELTCSTPLSIATMENQAGLPLVLFCSRTSVVPPSFGYLSGEIIK